MEISEFKKYTKNLDAYTASEIDELTPMTVNELEAYQYELDHDSGNLSQWDNIRAIVTLKKQILEQHEKIIKYENALRDIKELVEYREYGDDEIIEMIERIVFPSASSVRENNAVKPLTGKRLVDLSKEGR